MERSYPDADAGVVRTTIVFEGGLVLAAVALGWLFGRSPFERLHWTWPGAALGLLATVPLALGLILADRIHIAPLRELERVLQHSILPLFRAATTRELLLISALAGLGEELLFRGVLQDAIQRATASPWWALGLASLLFGLAHPISRTYALVAGLMGAYFGGLYLATGNLLVPTVTHAAYDFFALLYLLRSDLPGEGEAPADEWLV